MLTIIALDSGSPGGDLIWSGICPLLTCLMVSPQLVEGGASWLIVTEQSQDQEISVNSDGNYDSNARRWHRHDQITHFDVFDEPKCASLEEVDN